MKQTIAKIPVKTASGLIRLIQSFGYPKFPATVRVEITNICNARCATCVRDLMTRDKGIMDFALFKKIVDECAQHNVRAVHLHNFGESLIDKGLFEKIQYATQKKIKTKLFSNISLLNAEKARLLVESGLSQIKVSIDGFSKETFESIRRGLSFETIIENIEILIKTRNSLHSTIPKIGLIFVETPQNKHEIEAFINHWHKKVDTISISSYHNWGGDLNKINQNSFYGFPCLRIWQSFTILWNGNVALCCMDYNGKILLGNIKNNSIFNIFNNEKLQEIRAFHLNGRFDKITICENCNARS